MLFRSHQLPPTGTSAKYVGAGLGLAISQQVSHLLGGQIDLESEVGVGSTFTLTLPIHQATGERS